MTINGKVIWQEPPASRFGLRRVPDPDWLPELKAHPNRWALVETGVKGSRAPVLKKRFPGLQTVSRRRADGASDIYARWAGEGAPTQVTAGRAAQR